MFCAIVRQGISRSFCSMNDTCSLGPTTISPATLTMPALGLARPEPMLSRVLLPQPDGPMIDTTSPGAIEKLTSCAASTSLDLPRAAKRFSTPMNSIAGTPGTGTKRFMAALPAQLPANRR